MKKIQFTSILLIFFLILGLGGLRLLHISADPPADLSWSGGIFFDEGAYTHNARNKLLFDEWKVDEWNDYYYSPVLAYIKLGVFSVIGVGIAQERLISIVFCGLTLCFLYLALRVTLPRKTAILSVVFLGLNYIYVMYSRLGLFEIPLLFFTVLTMYFWQLGLKRREGMSERRNHAFMFLAGVSCFTVYIFKALLIYFLPVPLVGLAVLWFVAENSAERKRLLKLTGTFILGMIATLGVWLLVFYLPNRAAIQSIGSFIKMLSFPRSLGMFYHNVTTTQFFSFFMQTPIMLLVALLYLFYPLTLLFQKRSTLESVDVFMCLWFFANFFFLIGYGYRPPRYFLPIIPPMCVLAARGIIWAAHKKTLKIPYAVASWIWGMFWLIGTVVCTWGFIPFFYRYGAIPRITVPHLSGYPALALGTGLALLCTFAAYRISRQYRGGKFPLPHRVLIVVALALVVFSVGLNGHRYYRWARDPHHVIRDISRDLGTRLDQAFIAGLATPMLCLENTHRALYVWEDFTNYQRTFERFPITHLFLGEFNGEHRYYQRKFADIMRRATLLKTYWIKGGRFFLYSIIDPTIKQATVGQTRYGAEQPVSVQVEVKNNDPRRTKNIDAGWLLSSSSVADFSITAQETFLLDPLEERALSVARLVPAGTYVVMAALFPAHQEQHEAERLAHQIGQNIADPLASNGFARYGKPGESGFLTYGPYHHYPVGAFETKFLIKTSSLESGQLARIDVSADRGNTILAEHKIYAEDIEKVGSYQAFHLTYRLESPQNLEFRVVTYGTHPIWVDKITTKYFQGTWIETPIVVEPEK